MDFFDILSYDCKQIYRMYSLIYAIPDEINCSGKVLCDGRQSAIKEQTAASHHTMASGFNFLPYKMQSKVLETLGFITHPFKPVKTLYFLF